MIIGAISKITWLHESFIPHGWGNGYVGVTEGHPWFRKHYDDIEVDIHGGLTFSEFKPPVCFDELIQNDPEEINPHDTNIWWVGFDTAHFGDTKNIWTKSEVINETNNLIRQAKAAETKGE